MNTAKMNERDKMLTVAAVQFEPKLGEVDRNRKKVLALCEQAFSQGVRLIVTPEASISGYVFIDREEAAQYAETIPGGPTVSALEKLATANDGYIVCGIIEKSGDHLYNSAALVGPNGFIGKYRKTHLWDVDTFLYEKGDLGFPVFDLPFGRVGISICWDNWFPEVNRIYAMQGVDIVCHPTNWVVVPGMASPENPAWAFFAMTQAHVNGLFMICAGRIGTEREVSFGGSSCICGLPGFLHGPAGDKEIIAKAQIKPSDASNKYLSSYNHLLNDRRTDLYDAFLGYKN